MKTNVLQLIGSFHQGGSERQAVQLVKLLDGEEKYRIFPACLDKNGVLRGEIEELGYIDFPEYKLTSFYDTNMLHQLGQLVKFLRKNDITIIQTHDFYTNVFGMFAAVLARTPVRIAAKRETGTKTSKQEFIERRAYNLAHGIVVNAEAVKKHLINLGVTENKISVIYNGLDFERLSVSAVRSRVEILQDFGLPIDENRQFITIVANFRSDVKNHRMFLRAAKLVKATVGTASFILAGEGELLTAMKSFAAKIGIENHTHFIGRCSRVSELLSVSEICVLSSRTEGFSNSILEYMAAAKPVVATDVGGASEAIIQGKTGFLVESNDDNALAMHLIMLLNSPEQARRMGETGRKVVEEKFSLRAQQQKTLTLYENLQKTLQK